MALVTVAGALALAVAVCGRTSPRPATSDDAWAAWRSAPLSGRVMFTDPAVVATQSGWLAAWSRWERGSSTVVQVAALGRDGALKGQPVTLSSPEMFARGPQFARSPHGTAVVWAGIKGPRFEPRVWFAAVDDDARVRTAPRRIGSPDDKALYPSVAWGGEGWGVAWMRLNEPRGAVFARLTPEGEPRGEPVHVGDANGFHGPALTWGGGAWLVTYALHHPETDVSRVQLRWFDGAGRPLARHELARSRGEPAFLSATARGASTWVVWGDDMGVSGRHDPRLARLDERTVAQGPRPLGPRRSGTVPAIACAGDGCTLAWSALPEREGARAELYVQRVDVDGNVLGDPRSVGPKDVALPWSLAALATSTDERETLALWNIGRRDQGGLLVARLNADGVPMAPPRELPLR